MEPKIYVASLADYNAGRLVGAWIDAAQEPDELQDAINAILATSKEPIAEEWAIHDYEDMPEGLGEYPSLETVSKIALALSEHGDAFKVAYENFSDVDEALEAVEDNYQGVHKDLEEYAAQFLEETGELSAIPENLRYYFDYEAYARDLELGGDVWTADAEEGGIHVFWSR